MGEDPSGKKFFFELPKLCGRGKMARQRILFLDAHDSFSNNITALLSSLLDVDVFLLTIDSPLLDVNSPGFKESLRRELSHYAAVVCGPGPGSPTNAQDVGLMRHLWTLADEDIVPVLGICLGFQSLVASFGGAIRRLQRALHGMVRQIEHRESRHEDEGDIFQGVGKFKATLYHSLCADVGQDLVMPEDWSTRKWTPSRQCPDLVPLAWVDEERENGVERILMAVRHRAKPFWGLQYHPESICTDQEGHEVLRNWFDEATRWNTARRRTVNHDDELLAGNATRRSLLSYGNGAGRTSNGARHQAIWETYGLGARLHSTTLSLPAHVQVPDLVEVLRLPNEEHIILDSSNASVPLPSTAADVRGRYSIIALDVQESLRLEHCAGTTFATAKLPYVEGIRLGSSERISLKPYQGIWQLLAEFHEARSLGTATAVPDSPFFGGFMGFVTYEQGLFDIGVQMPQDRGHQRPDICFAWVTKTLVIDHKRAVVHIQHLRPDTAAEDAWAETTASTLQGSHLWHHESCDGFDARTTRRPSISMRPPRATLAADTAVFIQTPDPTEYERKVRVCQEYIAAGESYELCLTDQTTVTLPGGPATHSNPGKRRRSSPRGPGAWQLYRALRSRLPAPFASYIRLGGATLVGGSPERFLRHDGAGGGCTMKPMKGTVRKAPGAATTLARAEALLRVPKEQAENLMIVDLVRHDLHGLCGPGRVAVPRLMGVEEHANVFQMVTVVEARLPARRTGLDVLAASLPPGSMTGAPKRRSCELLRRVEAGAERSLYSGVVGYMCASGRGDWSVTIRSLFRWDDEQTRDDGDEVWHLGAGGAVTILSTPQGERDEMFVKLAGPLGIFEGMD